MVIMGIDASTKCTGYGLVNTNGELLVHGMIDFKSEKDIDIRIDGMMKELIKLFEMYKPDIVYIEDSWKANKVLNIETTKKLTNIIGAVRCLCIQNKCLFNSVYPTEWRSVIGISEGKGTKRQEFKERAVKWVMHKFNIDVSDDEAEGVCIAYAGNIMNNSMFDEEELF